MATPKSSIPSNSIPSNSIPSHMIYISNKLFNHYDRFMLLKLYIDTDDDNELVNKYYKAALDHNTKIHNNLQFIDAGFDLFSPTPNSGNAQLHSGNAQLHFFTNSTNQSFKHDLKVIGAAQIFTDTGKVFNTGYYLHPRSSIIKTPLRLANATGIVDAGYRGHLIAAFDVNNQTNSYYGSRFDRYVQICAPGLMPILVEIVPNKKDLGEDTVRGEGGFGSTGN